VNTPDITEALLNSSLLLGQCLNQPLLGLDYYKRLLSWCIAQYFLGCIALVDFCALVKIAFMKLGRTETILEEVRAAVKRWPEYAEQADVLQPRIFSSMIFLLVSPTRRFRFRVVFRFTPKGQIRTRPFSSCRP